MADPRDMIDDEIERFANEWRGPLPDGLLNSLSYRLRSTLDCAPPADPLAETLESERLRAALIEADRRLFAGTHVCRVLCDRFKGGRHVPDCPFAALATVDHRPALARWIAALTRFESVMSTDGEGADAAIDELRAAGRGVLEVVGGEVPG